MISLFPSSACFYGFNYDVRTVTGYKADFCRPLPLQSKTDVLKDTLVLWYLRCGNHPYAAKRICKAMFALSCFGGGGYVLHFIMITVFNFPVVLILRIIIRYLQLICGFSAPPLKSKVTDVLKVIVSESS